METIPSDEYKQSNTDTETSIITKSIRNDHCKMYGSLFLKNMLQGVISGGFSYSASGKSTGIFLHILKSNYFNLNYNITICHCDY